MLTAAAVRVVNLRDLPAGLFCDEAALGYNAWAILHYGVDENGTRLPLFLWSFNNSYKNPVYFYSAMLPIGIFGLSEFSLRLTSAAFGIATVLVLFLIGRALYGNTTGLAAAALLAICPWHVHFSRIAFELIAFPLLFAIGLLFLIRFIQGNRTLPLAFFFFGACLYAYAIAKLFIPLFLIGFGLLYLPTVKRRFREWLVAVPVLLVTVAPVVVFDITHRERVNAYFRNTSIFRPGVSLHDVLIQFGHNYAAFFSPRFLFKQGDEIVRHAVRGHGELYPFMAPFLAIGLLVLLLRPDRPSKLLLLWLALYPVGASLMNEIPSASRGIIGAPAFCLAAGIGIAGFLSALAWIGRRRVFALLLQFAAVAGLLVIASIEAAYYFRLYAHDYPQYASPTYGGFQYGYRDVLATMEPQRSRYSLLMLTATDVNQPQIFPLFYNRVDPRVYAKTGSPGYLVLDPAEYGRYTVAQPILYALRETDLRYFSDYTIQKSIVAPGGEVEFVIAELRARKSYITQWETLGLFANPDGAGVGTDFIDVSQIAKRRYDTKAGPDYWRVYTPGFVRTDLNVRYRKEGSEAPNDVCAYSLTVAEVPTPRRALLELSGSQVPYTVWLNGQSVTPVPVTLGFEPKVLGINLVQGKNDLVLKSCKRSGDWYFLARFISPEQREMPDVSYRAEIRDAPPPPRSSETSDLQVIEGFERIVSSRYEDNYPDYRGNASGGRAYRQDNSPEVRWLTAPSPKRLTTVIAFTASVAEEPGRADLWIDGEYALTFETGVGIRKKTWQRGDYRLTFLSKQIVAGNSGIFLLTVPASSVAPGKPFEIRVVTLGEDGNPWFMIKEHRDTVRFEKLSPSVIRELEASRPAVAGSHGIPRH